MKLYKVKAYMLGPNEVNRVVSVTAPDGSSTVVGVLKRVDKTLVMDLPPGVYELGHPDTRYTGAVTLTVGPWRAQVSGHSLVTVEVEEEALPATVDLGELVAVEYKELEA